MTVLLDTSRFTPAERIERVSIALESTTAPCRVSFTDRSPVSVRVSAWDCGSVSFWRNEATSMRMRRTEAHVRQDSDGRVAIAVQERGGSAIMYSNSSRVEDRHPGDLILADLTLPYEYEQSTGSVFCLSFPGEMLGLRESAYSAAAHRLKASPVYELMRRHLLGIARDPETLTASHGAVDLGLASVNLARALIATTTVDRGSKAFLADIAAARITDFVDLHLGDSDLDAAMIGRALHLSERTIYKTCADAGFRLEDDIIARRLARARADLESASLRGEPIGAIAHRWGFKDASHFSRRFRARYGCSPREWRATHIA
ncbi:helix-turn-helix domain-containing protein [Microbacterium sp. CFBP9034]|uniref:helix-turn-helix domain-containing protein n=1 Tax=Microbacterium sp. CFBP9034 TaxID=3096540 RepID=UPI002A6A14CD|nr:helix-turn-helix domain-containing protein [Microbacterium sp. CFBP9034]MDY0910142.1 helix-turn-helix domain-containing protein [Microbacterium sp. CFBP9034]